MRGGAERGQAPRGGGCGARGRERASAGAGRTGSYADPGPALPAPGGQHRAARPGAHPQPEPMRLGAASVVRLERALAHRKLHLTVSAPGSPATRRASAQQAAREAFESVHVTRITDRRSNQGRPAATGSPSILAGSRNGRLANAAPPARLGCGQPARRSRGGRSRADHTAVQRRSGTARSAACTACGKDC
jgi:hypothetical protein